MQIQWIAMKYNPISFPPFGSRRDAEFVCATQIIATMHNRQTQWGHRVYWIMMGMEAMGVVSIGV